MILVGRVGLEPTLSDKNGFTARGDTKYALPAHMVTPAGFEPCITGLKVQCPDH